MAKSSGKATIKKYANRRLYNTRSSSYITLDHLAKMTREGVDFKVLDAKTGKVRWTKSLRDDFSGQPGKWAYAESPLVDGDKLIVTPGGGASSSLGNHRTRLADIEPSANSSVGVGLEKWIPIFLPAHSLEKSAANFRSMLYLFAVRCWCK